MAKCPQFGQTLRAGFFLIAACGVTAGFAAHAQTAPVPEAGTKDQAAAKTSSYEIVSIKPSNPKSQNIGYGYLPNGFYSTNLPLRVWIDDAYNIAQGDGITGLPGWANTEPYDVQAKVDAATAEAAQKLSLKELIVLQRPMLQSLLADRYRLKAHLETRLGPAYDLVVAKGGFKMKEEPEGEKATGMISDGKVTAHAMLLDPLVSNLVGWTGRKVIDKTGLAGRRFDFELKWSPDGQSDAANTGPSIFSALEEQLGLKLVPSQAPMKTLVIDHIDRPSPN
jgi:uncharacterized protein (TIGR03435 family)